MAWALPQVLRVGAYRLISKIGLTYEEYSECGSTDCPCHIDYFVPLLLDETITVGQKSSGAMVRESMSTT